MNARVNTLGDKPCALRKQMAVQAVGVETLLYDEQRHMAFCLNASAAAVWQSADGIRSIAEIAVAASAETALAIDEEIVRMAVDQLRECGLMEAPDKGSEAAMSRRVALARIGIAALIPVVASIVAPTAAQAYSGCVDCSVARPLRRPGQPPGPGSPNR